MNRRWICNDVWMDIFPSFDRPQLGLKLALLSPRFDALVDKHFNGKFELTIWRSIAIRKDKEEPEPKLYIRIDDECAESEFPLPDRPLSSKIRFTQILIKYIDHSVITFLRSNQQIFDKRGTNLHLFIYCAHIRDEQPIWDIFVRELWPIFSTNIRHLGFNDGDALDIFRRRTSPTILTDLNQLVSIYSGALFPAAIDADFDVPNPTISAGQALSKWLHIPRNDGQPKRLRCCEVNLDWVNNFKEHFLCANAISSVSYAVLVSSMSMPMIPFEFVNERTKEKLTLTKAKEFPWTDCWIMQRCKIGETAAVRFDEGIWDNNCNNVSFRIDGTNCIRPLSPPPAKKKKPDKASQKGHRLFPCI